MLKEFRRGIEYFNQNDLYDKVKDALSHVPWVGSYTLTYISDPDTSVYYKYYSHSELIELSFMAEENWIDELS